MTFKGIKKAFACGEKVLIGSFPKFTWGSFHFDGRQHNILGKDQISLKKYIIYLLKITAFSELIKFRYAD